MHNYGRYFLYSVCVVIMLLFISLRHFVSNECHKECQDKYPMHLVDVIWENAKKYTVYSIDVEYEYDADLADSDNIYICPFYGRLSNCRFYIGYVSLIPEVAYLNSEKNTSYIGPGFIFARWDTLDARYMIAPKGSYTHSTDRENGKYVSIRTPFRAVHGKYAIHMSVQTDSTNIASFQYNKIKLSAVLHCKQSGRSVELGSILFDEPKAVIDGYIYSFVELYQKSNYNKTINVVITSIKINGNDIGDVPVSARYNADTYAMAKAVLNKGSLTMRLAPSYDIIREEKYVQLR